MTDKIDRSFLAPFGYLARQRWFRWTMGGVTLVLIAVSICMGR